MILEGLCEPRAGMWILVGLTGVFSASGAPGQTRERVLESFREFLLAVG